jgi:hypothetical protein
LQKTPEVGIRVRSKRRFVAKSALKVRLLRKWTLSCCDFSAEASRTVAVSFVATSGKLFTIGAPKSMIASDGSGPPFFPTRISIAATCLLAGNVVHPSADAIPVVTFLSRAPVRLSFSDRTICCHFTRSLVFSVRLPPLF